MALPRLYMANGEDKREILRMTLSGFLKTRAPRDRNYLPGTRGIALQPLLAATYPISLELFSSNYCCNNEPWNYVDREQSSTYLEIDRRPKSWNWSHALENQEKTYEDTFFFIFLFCFIFNALNFKGISFNNNCIETTEQFNPETRCCLFS